MDDQLSNENQQRKVKKPKVKFLCDMCGAFYSGMTSLLKHQDSHLQIKRYKCEFCDKSFVQKNSRDRHILVHTGDKSFSCDICGTKFGQRVSLYRHKKNVHKKKSVTCDICKKSFQTEESLENHKNHIHKSDLNDTVEGDGNDKQQKYDCKYCDRSYFCQNSMISHVRLQHEKDKLRSCNICDKKFAFAHKLKRHIRGSHGRTCMGPEKQKTFQCSECKEVFINKATLERHKPVCTSNTYHCSLCEYSCGTSGALKIHVTREHINPKPVVDHSCKICKKTFSPATASRLRRHMLGVHRDVMLRQRCQQKRHQVKPTTGGMQNSTPSSSENRRGRVPGSENIPSLCNPSTATVNNCSQDQAIVHKPAIRDVTTPRPFDLTSYINMNGSNVNNRTSLKWDLSDIHPVLHADRRGKKQNAPNHVTARRFSHSKDSGRKTKNPPVGGEKQRMNLRNRTSVNYEDFDDLDDFEDFLL